MSSLWIVMGIVAAVVLVPVVIGMCLPHQHRGRTTALLAKSPEDVWVALHDAESHPMTGKMMKSVEALPKSQWVNDLPAWVEDIGHGERITVTTVESDRPARFVREMASAAMPMTSRWAYTLEEVGDGCRVTIEGETHIGPGSWLGPIFRFMMVVGGGVKKGLDIQIDMAARTLGVAAQRSS